MKLMVALLLASSFTTRVRSGPSSGPRGYRVQPSGRATGDYQAGDAYRDVSPLPGQYERVKVSAQCTFVKNERGKPAVQPLVRLVAYHPAP